MHLTTEQPVAPPKESKTVPIILAIALVASLAGVGVLFAQNKKLQDQLEQTRAEVSKSEAAGAKLKSDLEQARTAITALQSDAEKAKAAVTALKSDLEETKEQISIMAPLVAKAREMLVGVSFRKAVLGSGLVLCRTADTESRVADGIQHTTRYSLFLF